MPRPTLPAPWAGGGAAGRAPPVAASALRHTTSFVTRSAKAAERLRALRGAARGTGVSRLRETRCAR